MAKRCLVEGTEDIPREVGGFAGGDVIEQFRGGDADAGIDPWRGDPGAMFVGRAFKKADDPSLGIQGDGAVGAGPGMDEQCGEGVALVMETDQGGQIVVGEDVAVLDEEAGLIAEIRLELLHATGGAEEGGVSE